LEAARPLPNGLASSSFIDLIHLSAILAVAAIGIAAKDPRDASQNITVRVWASDGIRDNYTNSDVVLSTLTSKTA
jgi:hypothetical protein